MTEQDRITNYIATYGPGPHLTSDVILLRPKAGDYEILLVTRGKWPGEGKLALPGGFVDVQGGESFYDAALRELVEETNVDASVFNAYFKAVIVADDPNRDVRGRVVSVAHVFRLPAWQTVTFKAGDDAKDVDWHPVDDLDPNRLYADHYKLIMKAMYG